MKKVNDLSKAAIRFKFAEKNFVPETRLAVAMGRVSTKRQKGEAHQSDKVQLDTIQDYLKRLVLTLACDIWDVAETASKHDRRTKFNQMLDVVSRSQRTERAIKHIVFSHQSRSNRNRESARAIEELVRKHGVTLHCARENLVLTSSSPFEDWIKWDLFNNMNEKAINDHRRNVWDGTVGRLELGLFPGKAPFGYKNFRPSENELSVFVLDSDAAKYMSEVYELMATGLYQVAEVCEKLSPKYAHVPRKPLSKKMWELLRNPFYRGDFKYVDQIYKGNPTYHPALVSREIWDRTQHALDSSYRRRKNKRIHPYLGLIRCGGRILNDVDLETEEPCGCAVTAEEHRKLQKDGSVKRHYYYHCSNSSRRCSQRNGSFMRSSGRGLNYTESEIEMLFEAVFRPLNFTPDVCAWMQQILREEHQTKSQDHKERITSLLTRDKMLERYIDHAYEDKLAGQISEELWRQKNQQWLAERENVRREIQANDNSKQDYIENGVLLIELAQRTEHIYKTANSDVKRKLVQIVSSNHVLRNGNIEFDYTKPFDVLAKTTSKETWWRRRESNPRP